jgi:hypothetical protein
LILLFRAVEDGSRTHSGCARFGGDEWNTDRRYSIQPRAVLQGEVSLTNGTDGTRQKCIL